MPLAGRVASLHELGEFKFITEGLSSSRPTSIVCMSFRGEVVDSVMRLDQ